MNEKNPATKYCSCCLQEFLVGSPLADITDGLINSPMSVESAKTDTSGESLTDIKKLGSLSLVLSNENSKLSVSTNDLSPSFTQLLHEVKVKSPIEGGIEEFNCENDPQDSFIDAVLTGMFSEFAEQEAKTGVKPSLADAMNFSDNLFENLTFNLKVESPTTTSCSDGNESRGGDTNAIDQSAFYTRSVSTPADDHNNKPTTQQRKSRLKSDTSFDNRTRRKPYKKNSCLERSSVDNNELDEEGSAFQIRPQTHPNNNEHSKTSKDSKMFFENKDYFRLRLHLRELTSLQTRTDVLVEKPGQLLMKSSKLFLHLLTEKHRWALDSVSTSVKNDKELNMKNFTKRKITIHNDISPDRVSVRHLFISGPKGLAKPFKKLTITCYTVRP